ncbi:glycosyltransferase [Haloferax denitrificans]|uniref:glycosyltransferase n=1 Tax=Haloferax denitrificans TaxID=35745 RepID=UPI003C6EB11B
MGGDHRTHGLVKEFPAAGDTVIRYCQGGSPAMYRSLDLRRRVEIAEGYEERRHLHPLHELTKAQMLLGYPNLFAGESLRFANDGLPQMLSEADVVMVREPWQMPFVLNRTPEKTPIVFSSHNVETERFGDIEQPVFKEWTEQRVAILERRAVEKSDAIICTSNRDKETYNELYDLGGPAIVAPNGTYKDDLRDHRPDSESARVIRRRYGITPDETVCLFMGSNYQPNVDAAKAAIDVMRTANNSGKQVHLLILGSVGNAFDGSDLPPNVTTTGFVEDGFESHFDAADIALNPMRTGGGTNIKLIDYMARSLPIISTPFGVRGLDVVDGEHLVVAELDAYLDTIMRLRNDPERRHKLGSAARDIAAANYTWEFASRHIRKQLVDRFGPF